MIKFNYLNLSLLLLHGTNTTKFIGYQLCADNGLGSVGGQAIADVLKANTSLTKLDISRIYFID